MNSKVEYTLFGRNSQGAFNRKVVTAMLNPNKDLIIQLQKLDLLNNNDYTLCGELIDNRTIGITAYKLVLGNKCGKTALKSNRLAPATKRVLSKAPKKSFDESVETFLNYGVTL